MIEVSETVSQYLFDDTNVASSLVNYFSVFTFIVYGKSKGVWIETGTKAASAT